MNRKLLTVLLVIAMVLALAPTALATSTFSDVGGHWAEKDINAAVSSGYVKGYADGTFKPDANITRAEFVAMVNSALKTSEVSSTLFTDVTKSNWYYSDVQKAVFACYVNGYEDNTFRPNNLISRAEAAAIISRIVPTTDNLSSNALKSFTDRSSIADWAEEAAGAIADKGYINGYPDGTFRPSGKLTRAEAVSIINRILSNETIISKKATLKADKDSINYGIYVGGVEVASSVAEGSVVIDDSMILSTMKVLGGGSNTVEIKDSLVAVLNSNKDGGNPVRIQMIGNTTIQVLNIFQNTILDDEGLTGAGVVNAYIDGDDVSEVEVSGTIANLTVSKACKIVVKKGGHIGNITVNVKGVVIEVEDGGYVGTVTTNGNTKLRGEEAIQHLIVNNGSDDTYVTEPEKITINDGTAKEETTSTSSGGGGGGGNSGGGVVYLAAPTGFALTNVHGDYTFSWTNDTEAGSYSVSIKKADNTVLASNITVDRTTVAGKASIDLDQALATFLPSAAADAGANLTVTVTAVPGAGSSKSSNTGTQSLQLLARPAPSLVDDTPNDSVIDPATAKLSWSAVANAANYLLIVDSDLKATIDPPIAPATTLNAAIADYLSANGQTSAFRLIAQKPDTATFTISSVWSKTITRLAANAAITELELTQEDDGNYYIAWKNVEGNNGYTLYTDIPDSAAVNIDKDVILYQIPASWFNSNRNIKVTVDGKAVAADAWTIGGTIEKAEHGVNAPAAPSPKNVVDAANPFQITWEGVNFAENGYEVKINDTVIDLSGKVSTVSQNGKTVWTVNLQSDFAALPAGSYTVSVRAAARMTGSADFILPSLWAPVQTAGTNETKTYQIVKLDNVGTFSVDQSGVNDMLQWNDITSGTVNAETPVTGITADVDYDFSLVDPASGAFNPATDIVSEETAEHTFNPNLDGSTTVYIRATSEDLFMRSSDWVAVTLSRLAQPSLTLAEPANNYTTYEGFSQADRHVTLTLGTVTNATSYSLKKDATALALPTADITADFQTAAGNTVTYTYQAFGFGSSTADTVVPGGTLYLNSVLKSQDVSRLAAPSGIAITRDYTNAVAPFNTDKTKLGSEDREYIVNWNQITNNNGYLVKAPNISPDATPGKDANKWTLPKDWRDTQSTYINVMVAAVGKVDSFILSSYPTVITDSAHIQAINTKPILAAPTIVSGYEVELPRVDNVDTYDLMVTYTPDGSTDATDVTPSTGAQGIAKTSPTTTFDLKDVIKQNNGTYRVYVRAADIIETGTSTIGSTWSEPLVITNNRLIAPTMTLHTSIDGTLAETVTLNWNDPNSAVTDEEYVVTVDGAEQAPTSGNSMIITSLVAGKSSFNITIKATTDTFGWLDSQTAEQAVTRRATPTVSVTDNGSTVVTIAGNEADYGVLGSYYLLGGATFVGGTNQITADVTSTFNTPNDTSVTYAAVIKGNDGNFVLPSAIGSLTVRRLPTPSNVTLAGTYDNYSIAWDNGSPSVNGFKVFLNGNNPPAKTTAAGVFSVAANGTWMPINDFTNSIQVQALGDITTGVLDSQKSALLFIACPKAPTNVALSTLGVLTWNGLDGTKYKVDSITKDGNTITDYEGLDLSSLYTAAGTSSGSLDISAIMEANGTGLYGVTMRAVENLAPATKIMGSVTTAPATQTIHVATAPTLSGISQSPTPTPGAVDFLLPTDAYTGSFTVTITPPGAPTGTINLTATAPSTTLSLDLATYFSSPGLYTINIEPNALPGSLDGNPFSFTVEKLTTPTVEIRNASVHLYWPAANLADQASYYTVVNNADTTKTYSVQACGENLVPGVGYFHVDITADCVAGETPEYTVSRNGGTDNTDPDTIVNFTLSANGVLKQVIRLANVDPTSFVIDETTEADCSQSYTLSWDDVTDALGYATVAGATETAITMPYALTPVAGQSSSLSMIATGSTDSGDNPYYVKSATPTTASISALGAIAEAELNGNTANWTPQGAGQQFQFRILKLDGATSTDVTATFGADLPQNTTLTSKDLSATINKIKADGAPDSSYAIQVRSKGNLIAANGALVIGSPWQTIKGVSDLVTVNTNDEWDVTFTVVDGSDQAINGAHVAIAYDGNTYEGTAAAGSNTVTLTGLPGGTYNATITATADDYDNYTSAKDITVSDLATTGEKITMTLAKAAYAFTVNGEAEDDTVGDIIITTADGLTPVGTAAISGKTASIDLLPGNYAYTLNATYDDVNNYPYTAVASTPFTVVRQSVKNAADPADTTKDNTSAIPLTKITYNTTFVFNGSTDSPVKDVTFSLTGPTTVTGKTVTSSVNHVQLALLPGTYSLSASKTGYDVYTGTFSVPDADSLIESDLTLLDSSDIQFTVKSGTLNLTGATVNIFNATDDVATATPVKTLTTTNGTANCGDTLSYGDYKYVVTAGTDYLEGSGAFTLSSSSVIRETVDLKLPVTFTVKSGTTDTISTASFTGIDAPTYDSVSKTYTINLAAGTYSVQASTGTYTAQTKDFTLVDGGILDYTYDLTSEVTIIAKKAGGDLFPGVGITVDSGSAKTTGADGSAIFDLKDGNHGYTAQYPGMAAVVDQPITFTVANGSVAAADQSKLTVILFENHDATFSVNFGVTVDGNAAASGFVSVDSGTPQALSGSGNAQFNLTAGSHIYSVTYGGNTVVSSKSFTVSASGTVQDVPVALYTVSLNLVADASNNPATVLDDVTVTLGGFTAVRTSPTGNTYAVVVAGGSTYNYTVSDAAASDKYATLNLITPTISAATSIDVLMAKQTYDVTFTITDGTGDGVGGALITVYTDAGGNTVYGTYNTNSAGQYVVSGVAPTDYWFKVTKDGYEASAITAFTVANSNTPVNLTLTATANKTVQFTVNSGDVTKMQNVAITIKKAGATLDTINTTNTGIGIKTLLLGDYTYSVSVAGYNAVTDAPFTVTSGTSLVEIPLTIPVTVAVQSGSTKIADAIFQNGGVTLTPTAFDAATGKYTFDMAAGTYTLDVTKTNYNANQVALTVNTTGDQTAYAVTMTSNASFHATYDGNALGGVEIKNGGATIATTADGTGIATAALTDGTYTFTAVKTYYVSSNATSFNVTVTNGVASPATTDIIMAAQTGALLPVQFTVNLDGGDPVASKAVFEIETVGHTAQPNATITSGNSVTTNLVAGAYTYTLKYDGKEVKTGSFDVVAVTGATVPAISLSTLDFHATDAVGGAGLPGVNITVGGLTITTLANGTASIVLATADSYTFTASLTGYQDVTQTGTSPFNFNMATKTYSAVFNVHKDSLSGDGVTGATIKVYSNDTLITQVGSDLTTSGLGSATLSSLAPGQYWYTIEKTGYTTTYNSSTPGTFTIGSADETVEAYLTTVTPATTYPITFSVGGGVTGNIYAGSDQTSGTVLNASPVANTNVIQLAAGNYTFYAAAQNGYEEVIQNFTVTDSGKTVTVGLTVPYTVTVKSGDTLVSGATVTLGGAAPDSINGNVYTFSVAAGDYTLSVSKSGYTAQSATVTAAAVSGTGTTVNLVAPISVSAIDANSSALSGVLFTLTKGGVDYTDTTGVAGTASINLEDGVYSLKATKTGYVPVTMINVTVAGGALTSDPVTAVMVVNTSTLYNVTFHISSDIAANVDITVDGTSPTTIPAGDNDSTPALSLTAGTHSLSAVASGYTVTPSSFTVPVSSDPLTVNLTATAVPIETQSVVFIVTSGSTAISNATISLTPTGASGSATTLTNLSGTSAYINENVEYGEYSYSVAASGYPTETGTITVDGDPVPLSLAVALEFPYSVLVESGGSPVSGASVTINGHTESTGSNGVAQFSIANGTYNIAVSKSGYVSKTVSGVAISSAGTTPVALLSDNIVMKFVDSTLTALQGVNVNVGGSSYTTDASGRISVADLADGDYSYTASKTNYTTSTGSFWVEGGDTNLPADGIVLALDASATFAVTFNITGPVTTDIPVIIDGFSYELSDGESVNLCRNNHSYYVEANTEYEATGIHYFTVDGEETVNIALVAVPDTIDLTITVKDATNSTGDYTILLNGAAVSLSNGMSGTTSNGTVTFHNVSATDAITYTVTKTGYTTASDTLTAGTTAATVSMYEPIVTPTTRTFNFALSQSDTGATIQILGVNDNSSFSTTVNVSGNSASVSLADGDYIFYYTTANGYTVSPAGWNDFTVSGISTTENITLTTP